MTMLNCQMLTFFYLYLKYDLKTEFVLTVKRQINQNINGDSNNR